MSGERQAGAERDMERIVRAWLHEARYENATRVLESVLDPVDTTPQRRAARLGWRIPIVHSTPLRLGLAAALVIIMAVFTLALVNQPNVGHPSPSPGATPRVLTRSDLSRALPPGRYAFFVGTVHPELGTERPDFNVELTLPAGWVAQTIEPSRMDFNPEGEAYPYIGFFSVYRVYTDPCHPEKGTARIGLVPDGVPANASDLERGLSEMTGFDVGPVTETTIGGLPARHFVLSNHIDTSSAGCTDGDLLLIVGEARQGSERVDLASIKRSCPRSPLGELPHVHRRESDI